MLRDPVMLPGVGRVVRSDAVDAVDQLGEFDLAYIDPPYNSFRYHAGYHIWETLTLWDAPEWYGTTRRRVDLRDAARSSVFNVRAEMPDALRGVLARVPAECVVLSHNDESWITRDELADMCSMHDQVRVLEFDAPRYVGARTGLYNPAGVKVGSPKRVRNIEYVVVAGPRGMVDRMVAGLHGHGSTRQAALPFAVA